MKSLKYILLGIYILGFSFCLISNISTYFWWTSFFKMNTVFVQYEPELILSMIVPICSVWTWFYVQNQTSKFSLILNGGSLSHKPRWITSILFILVLYVLFNFLNISAVTGGGVPDIINSKYVVQNHGTIIRDMDEHEYTRLTGYMSRIPSSMYMVGYFGLICLIVDKKLRQHRLTTS
jgi:hypothetical protein